MTERQHLAWDHAQQAVTSAQEAVQRLVEAVPDDLAHHTARNRLVAALGALEDAAMFAERARTLATLAQVRQADLAEQAEAVRDRMVEREG